MRSAGVVPKDMMPSPKRDCFDVMRQIIDPILNNDYSECDEKGVDNHTFYTVTKIRENIYSGENTRVMRGDKSPLSPKELLKGTVLEKDTFEENDPILSALKMIEEDFNSKSSTVQFLEQAGFLSDECTIHKETGGGICHHYSLGDEAPKSVSDLNEKIKSVFEKTEKCRTIAVCFSDGKVGHTAFQIDTDKWEQSLPDPSSGGGPIFSTPMKTLERVYGRVLISGPSLTQQDWDQAVQDTMPTQNTDTDDDENF